MHRPGLTLFIVLLAPLALATAAHPVPHRYVGAGTLAGNGVLVPACADAPPPDGDPETGAGGACFPYATAYGDDTGKTVRVHLVDNAPNARIALLLCVDHDFSGTCEGWPEVLDVCETAPQPLDARSLTTPGPCLAYLDPAPLASTLYVIPLPADPTTSYAQPTSGAVWLT